MLICTGYSAQQQAADHSDQEQEHENEQDSEPEQDREQQQQFDLQAAADELAARPPELQTEADGADPNSLDQDGEDGPLLSPNSLNLPLFSPVGDSVDSNAIREDRDQDREDLPDSFPPLQDDVIAAEAMAMRQQQQHARGNSRDHHYHAQQLPTLAVIAESPTAASLSQHQQGEDKFTVSCSFSSLGTITTILCSTASLRPLITFLQCEHLQRLVSPCLLLCSRNKRRDFALQQARLLP